MALDTAFGNLVIAVARLRDALAEARITLVEDRPADGEALVADRMGDRVEDLLGSVHEALAHGEEARRHVDSPVDVDRARRALVASQRSFQQTAERFHGDMCAYEPIAEFLAFGRERGGAWLAWTRVAHVAVERCRAPLEHTSAAYVECWKEIAERVGMSSISVRAVNRTIESRDHVGTPRRQASSHRVDPEETSARSAEHGQR